MLKDGEIKEATSPGVEGFEFAELWATAPLTPRLSLQARSLQKSAISSDGAFAFR
jgi:hypothetical protein